MNCQLFETIVNDLARAATMDAQARDTALAHSEACSPCAIRLRDERMLTAGLNRVAASTGAKEAPARVELALRAAFREQHASRLAPAVINQSHGRRRIRWAFATAAMILILIALAALRLDHRSRPVENAGNVKPEQATPAFAPREVTPPSDAPSNASEQKVAKATKHKSSQTPRAAVLHNKDRAAQKPQMSEQQMSGSEAAEITTAFIPLMHGDDLNLMESGQMVRVELPRSALISFGLPMDMERAGERIKADVVLGNDGLARAIRFVR
jgi:hypothetical protein